MPKNKYDWIYQDLKKKIEADQYSYQELLPPKWKDCPDRCIAFFGDYDRCSAFCPDRIF